MPLEENTVGELFMLNEKGESVKICRFSEVQNWEIKQDFRIDLKKLYEAKFEGTLVLTPENEALLEELQKQYDAEVTENLKQQIEAVEALITAMKYCDSSDECYCDVCPYKGDGCIGRLMKDAIAIAEAYKRVVDRGLKMMEERK